MSAPSLLPPPTDAESSETPSTETFPLACVTTTLIDRPLRKESVPSSRDPSARFPRSRLPCSSRPIPQQPRRRFSKRESAAGDGMEEETSSIHLITSSRVHRSREPSATVERRDVVVGECDAELDKVNVLAMYRVVFGRSLRHMSAAGHRSQYMGTPVWLDTLDFDSRLSRDPVVNSALTCAQHAGTASAGFDSRSPDKHCCNPSIGYSFFPTERLLAICCLNMNREASTSLWQPTHLTGRGSMNRSTVDWLVRLINLPAKDSRNSRRTPSSSRDPSKTSGCAPGLKASAMSSTKTRPSPSGSACARTRSKGWLKRENKWLTAHETNKRVGSDRDRAPRLSSNTHLIHIYLYIYIPYTTFHPTTSERNILGKQFFSGNGAMVQWLVQWLMK